MNRNDRRSHVLRDRASMSTSQRGASITTRFKFIEKIILRGSVIQFIQQVIKMCSHFDRSPDADLKRTHRRYHSVLQYCLSMSELLVG